MPDYSKGKIYKLVSNHTDDIYIGSTCDLLSKRLYQHKLKFEYYQNGKGNYISSFEICKYDDVRILLMKEYPCENKYQLERKEGKYQEKYECVNKHIAGNRQKCEHDKRKVRCRDCGGSDFCKHDKRKDRCIECGGSDFCKHEKRKETCLLCGGSSTIKTKCPLCDKEMRKDSIKRHINNKH